MVRQNSDRQEKLHYLLTEKSLPACTLATLDSLAAFGGGDASLSVNQRRKFLITPTLSQGQDNSYSSSYVEQPIDTSSTLPFRPFQPPSPLALFDWLCVTAILHTKSKSKRNQKTWPYIQSPSCSLIYTNYTVKYICWISFLPGI